MEFHPESLGSNRKRKTVKSTFMETDMRRIIPSLAGWLLLAAFPIFTSFAPAQSTTIKCMVQTVNYTGENAYIVISLMNPEGEYERTLHVMGDDPEWYHMFDEWWEFFGRERRNIDGRTGATLGAGQRRVVTLQVDENEIDKGYKIRFETQVEDHDYFPTDVEIPLTSSLPKAPVEGSGYIRYVRLSIN